MITKILEKLGDKQDLTEKETIAVMQCIMDGQLSSAQIAAFLMGLKIKGETVDEIAGCVQVMRSRAKSIKGPDSVIDTCGTGGDKSSTFNISTASALVAAATGIPVAKHGNRSVSSLCGSADVLLELGVKIDLTPEQTEKCLRETGIAFLFAPVYHTSMKYAAEPRRDMGVRTVFNILGPMSNPAGAKRQIIGTFNLQTAEKMSQVLQKTGSEHVLIVHSKDGLDEISLSDETTVFEMKGDSIDRFQFAPEDVGVKRQSLDQIKGNNAADNASIIEMMLKGEKGAYADVTALNAGAAIYIGKKAESIKQGVDMAFDTIYSGKALEKFASLREFTQTVGQC